MRIRGDKRTVVTEMKRARDRQTEKEGRNRERERWREKAMEKKSKR